MEDYKITANTLALVPVNKNKTIIYENDEYFIINNNVNKIMESNCRYNGSDINGRKKGTYFLTGFNYKAPIIISENQEIIFFPTCSPRLSECSWINAKKIKTVNKKEKSSEVDFSNNEKITFEVSYNIIKNQYYKSLSLDNALKSRKNDN